MGTRIDNLFDMLSAHKGKTTGAAIMFREESVPELLGEITLLRQAEKSAAFLSAEVERSDSENIAIREAATKLLYVIHSMLETAKNHTAAGVIAVDAEQYVQLCDAVREFEAYVDETGGIPVVEAPDLKSIAEDELDRR